MIRGVFGHFSTTRIDNDGSFSFEGELFHFSPGNRMAIGWIGPNNHNTIGVFQIDDGVGGSTGTKGPLHTKRRRRVTNTGTAIDIIRTNYGTNEFLH